MVVGRRVAARRGRRQDVTIDGEQADGSDEVDVLAIDGKASRPGPAAVGRRWKVVGPKHPGWAQWKVDKQAGKAHGTPTQPALADALTVPAACRGVSRPDPVRSRDTSRLSTRRQRSVTAS